MSQSRVQNDQDKHDTGLGRRNFMSAGLFSGVTLALSPNLRASLADPTDAEPASVLPTPADSLSLYMILLDRVRGQILNPYFDLVGCLSGEVKSRYYQLREDVDKLERLVPQLRAAQQPSNLKSFTSVGQAAASFVNNLAREQIVLKDPSFTMVSFSPDSLNQVSVELESQRGSLTLSPAAAALIRTILAEIRDLQKPTEDLDKTSTLLTDLNNDLEGRGGSVGKITTIRLELVAAINELVADDLSGRPPSLERHNAAKAHIQKAIDSLKALDAYVPPDSLQAYVGSAHSTRCQPRVMTGAAAKEPTKGLRDLLVGTVKWIESGGTLAGSGERAEGDVFYLKVSTRPQVTPDWIARWYNARQILGELLPPATRTRTWICLGLIGPILVGYSSSQRVDLIYDQIPNMIPGGSYDHDDGKRRLAAQRFANL
ncbi:MAG: hypothetical protein QOI77_1413 [Blastocatellia bacterium]|nr:hypothetical protein [Blastocatellia bacterium]